MALLFGIAFFHIKSSIRKNKYYHGLIISYSIPGIKAAWTLLYHNYCTMDPHTRKRHLIPDPSFSKTRIGIDMYIKNTLLILCYRLWIIWRWLFNWMTVWMRACICFVFLVMSMLFFDSAYIYNSLVPCRVLSKHLKGTR